MRAGSVSWIAIASITIAACSPAEVTRRVHYPDGSLRWEYQTRNGVPHGVTRTFHPNKTLASEGHYVMGVKQGRFTRFDERGQVVRDVLYEDDVIVWSKPDHRSSPGMSAVNGLAGDAGPSFAALFDGELTPRPYFASIDRTTSLTRFGVQLGFSGDSDLGFGASRRGEVFANYRLPAYGVYAQLAGSMLEGDAGDRSTGRRTLELGATYDYPVYSGNLTPRLGLLVPVGGDDVGGFAPAAASSFQRPTDAAAATTSTVAIRTGASWTRSQTRLVMQADAGIDWLAGGAGAPIDALARANAAIGYGSQNAMLSLEASNTIRVSDPFDRIHALGVGGTIWLRGYWLTALVSRTTESHTAVTGSIGYGF
jgi:hypothetical protein